MEQYHITLNNLFAAYLVSKNTAHS